MPKNHHTIDIINEIVDMRISDMKSRKFIVDHLKTKYGYKNSYSYQLIQVANKKIEKLYADKFEQNSKEAKAQLEEMLQKAIEFNNDKLALSIRQELNKLLGLYQDKIDITTNGKSITDININIIRPNGND